MSLKIWCLRTRTFIVSSVVRMALATSSSSACDLFCERELTHTHVVQGSKKRTAEKPEANGPALGKHGYYDRSSESLSCMSRCSITRQRQRRWYRSQSDRSHQIHEEIRYSCEGVLVVTVRLRRPARNDVDRKEVVREFGRGCLGPQGKGTARTWTRYCV